MTIIFSLLRSHLSILVFVAIAFDNLGNALALLDYEAKDRLEQVRAWAKEENANKTAVSALNDAIYWEDKPSTTTADASDANSITP